MRPDRGGGGGTSRGRVERAQGGERRVWVGVRNAPQQRRRGGHGRGEQVVGAEPQVVGRCCARNRQWYTTSHTLRTPPPTAHSTVDSLASLPLSRLCILAVVAIVDM